jgi:hypothetical protein
MKTTPPDPVVARAHPQPEPPAHPLRDAWHAWERFWFAPGSPINFGLMRIFTGLIVLYVLFGYAMDLQGYVGPNGWVEKGVAEWVRKEIPIYAPRNSWDDQYDLVEKGQFLWSLYHHVDDPFWIALIHAGVMLATLLFTVGFATRVTSVLTWVGATMYLHRANSTLFGMDTMTNLGLIYLMLAPCGAALSVDRWLEVRRERRRFGPGYVPPPAPRPSATFVTRLVQVNFCYIYLVSGFSKLLGSSWWNATAPDLVLLNYSFAPFEVGVYVQVIRFLAQHRWLWEIIMTGGVVFTLWTEIGLPFLVWNRKMRWFMVCCSVLLHTAIGLFMGLVTFSLMMLVLLLVWVPPEVVEQVLARAGGRIRHWLHPRSAAPAGSARGASPLALAR